MTEQYPEGTVRVVLDGGIFNGSIYVYNMDGEEVDEEIGYPVSLIFNNWPDRLMMLEAAGDEGLTLVPNDA